MRECRNKEGQGRGEGPGQGRGSDGAGRPYASDDSLTAHAKPLISLEAARFFAKLPCISLQRPASGLHFLF